MNTVSPQDWIEQYSDYLYNYARIRVHNSEIAEDLVQETFLSALHARKNFEGRSTEKTWLTAILKNKIIDHYRKKSRQKEDSYSQKESPYEQEGDFPGQWIESRAPKSWDHDTQDLLQNQEFQEIYEQCMGHLPEKQASIFTLKVIEDMPTKDICKDFEITPSNLWVILHRARVQLRECLEKIWIKNNE